MGGRPCGDWSNLLRESVRLQLKSQGGAIGPEGPLAPPRWFVPACGKDPPGCRRRVTPPPAIRCASSVTRHAKGDERARMACTCYLHRDVLHNLVLVTHLRYT